MLQPYNERDLLHQIAGGDEIAFNQLYRQYSATIFNTVIRYIKDIETTKELVQLVFIKVWSNRISMAEVRKLEDYLFILTRNIVFDHFKKIALDKKILRQAQWSRRFHEHINNASERIEEHENAKLLETAIAELPPRQRQAYLLYRDEGLTYEEIADMLKLSKLTIKKHLELARNFLRNYFNVLHSHDRFIFFLVLSCLSRGLL